MAWTAPFTAVTGTVAAAADWNTYARDNLLFLYGDTSWTAPSYANSWVDHGDGPVGYRKIGTRVFLRGTMRNGTVGATAFTLAAGYRPTGFLRLLVNSNGTAQELQIATSGTVVLAGGSNAYVCLSGHTFDTL